MCMCVFFLMGFQYFRSLRKSSSLSHSISLPLSLSPLSPPLSSLSPLQDGNLSIDRSDNFDNDKRSTAECVSDAKNTSSLLLNNMGLKVSLSLPPSLSHTYAYACTCSHTDLSLLCISLTHLNSFSLFSLLSLSLPWSLSLSLSADVIRHYLLRSKGCWEFAKYFCKIITSPSCLGSHTHIHTYTRTHTRTHNPSVGSINSLG